MEQFNNIEITYNKALREMNKLIETNKNVKDEINVIHDYLIRKFALYFKKTHEQELAVELISDLIYSQISGGYWLASSELEVGNTISESERVFDDKTLAMPKGILRNALGASLEGIYNKNWYMFKGNEQINLRILNELPNGFETYRYVLELAAAYGIYLAIAYSENYLTHEQRKVEENLKKDTTIIFGEINDLQYTTPEVFMQYYYHNEYTECWNLFITESSRFTSKWVGSMTFTLQKDTHILKIELEDVLSSTEKSNVIKNLVAKLSKEQLNKTQLIISHLSDSPGIYVASKFLNY